jgi:hypothetical protein
MCYSLAVPSCKNLRKFKVVLSLFAVILRVTF